MDETRIDLQLTVDKVLQKWPRAVSVLMKNKTKCVGCFMQTFCTLKDVAETYQLSVERLIVERIAVDFPFSPEIKQAQHE